MNEILLIVLAISNLSVGIQPEALNAAPQGYVVSNLDPNLNSTLNNQIYDPNFLPGFNAGLTNTSMTWSSGLGYANVGYSIGPWKHQESSSIPHFAVGPQCCNFVEVSHTQQFRRVEWGDYYYIRSGFGPPGVNIGNYTTDFSSPADVGLRTDWDWRVQFSLDWNQPVMEDSANEWGAVGISATQFVPGVSGNLVSTLINLWMDPNSSSYVPISANGSTREVGHDVVTYHPVQISQSGNLTITLDISPFLQDTLTALGVAGFQNQQPVVSYVYLNVEGYNFAWNSTLWSFFVMSGQTSMLSIEWVQALTLAVAAVLILFPVYLVLGRKRMQPNDNDRQNKQNGQN